ncbi:MAG TPA: aldo/keto reductase [Bryobacteraceae bacterium]|nr:aldo/keto reductase [Bryobacteraceae bacterium]
MGGLADLYRAGFDMGVTFWDSADQYGSHPHLKEPLKNVPREKVTIMTKTHASTEAEMRADLDRFRKEIGVDYLDIVLLHCMMDGDWNHKKRGAMNVLTEARQKGIVKTHGVSNHTMEALKTAAAEPWVQVNLARFNAGHRDGRFERGGGRRGVEGHEVERQRRDRDESARGWTAPG